MGRRKITIQQITDPKLRNITYNKRKNGLIKKAAEIALLCDINLLLVFEDLNGTLVQFSRNPIKNIANFPKECNFKRVLELTSEDYPNFSRIKRHKKKNDAPMEEGLRTPMSTSSKASRSYADMMSESGSHVSKDELFTSDSEGSLDYGVDMMESPYSQFSESGFDITPAADLMQQVLPVQKALKTRMLTTDADARRQASQGGAKNKLNLRLNIPKAEDSIKGALGADSKGKKRGPPSSLKQNSTQKNYIRKSHFESVKSIEKKNDMTPSPYQMMNGNVNMNNNFGMGGMNNAFNNNNNMNMGFQNLFGNNNNNNRPLNLMTSPPKDLFGNHQGFGQMKMMGEEDNYGNASSFPEFSPFATGGYQMVGTTPPRQDQIRINPDDPYATEKIGNYLSHPGRSPPQQQHVFTFQQNDMRGLVENNMGGFSSGGYGGLGSLGLGMGDDNNSSKKNNSFWEFQLNDKNTYGKIEHGLSSGGGLSGNRPSFEGYAFGSNNDQIDWSEQFRRMKMT